MILMPMRKHDGLDHIAVFQQISDIRNNKIDPQHILIREHQTGINQQYLIIHPDDSHILADFS